jgi:hypothetical protein
VQTDEFRVAFELCGAPGRGTDLRLWFPSREATDDAYTLARAICDRRAAVAPTSTREGDDIARQVDDPVVARDRERRCVSRDDATRARRRPRHTNTGGQ